MKPEKIKILTENIPRELTTLNKWICWKWIQRKGKWTKPPYIPSTGKLAKSNDPTTWVSFFDALGACNKSDKYDGIGFMFSEDDPYTGIDFDDCRGKKTGTITPETLTEINSFNSYTEISPSQCGFKTLIKGVPPGKDHHSGALGVFSKTRYFCITGHVLNGYPTIENRQTELDEFYHKYWGKKEIDPLEDIIQQALRSDPKFASLYSGNIMGYPSQSEADSALCMKLAFWVGKDPAKIDYYFMQSGMYREKWQRKDYRDKTISRAIDLVSDTYSNKVDGVDNSRQSGRGRQKETGVDKSRQEVDRVDRNLSAEIRIWAKEFPGIFSVNQLDKDVGIYNRNDKKNRSKVLVDLVVEGIIERYGSVRGTYRTIDNEEDEIDFLNCKTNRIDFRLPFNLHNLVRIMPGNIIVIAGESNSGKTALIVNTILLNSIYYEYTNSIYSRVTAPVAKNQMIYLFSSEMRDQEMKLRLESTPVALNKWPTFLKAYSRSENFHDVIKPDEINIVDFLEVHDEFYKVGGFIRKIHEKLKNGICIICIQKNAGTDFGLGGQRSIEKARLYISLAKGYPHHVAKIVKGKNWINESHEGENVKFDVVKGWNLIQKTEWQRY